MLAVFGTGQISTRAASYFDPGNIGFREIMTGLTEPVFITNAGDNSARLFIIERAGQVLIYKNQALLSAPFLDIRSIVNSTGGEQGLLALAFHPNYGTNGQFYTVFTDQDGSLVLSRFTRSSNNPDLADPNSRKTLLTLSVRTDICIGLRVMAAVQGIYRTMRRISTFCLGKFFVLISTMLIPV
jgi:hypothetical protein